MNGLLKRTLTGMIVVAAVIGAVLAGRVYVLALVAVIGVSCLLELRPLCGSVWKYLLAGLYVLAGLTCLMLLYRHAGTWVTSGFFVLIWSSDIFAYVTGSLWGRHKLWPKVSPSKTWEGATGGFLFAMGFGYLWKVLFLPQIHPLGWLVFSVLTIVAGILGDLLESKIKRRAGVKDSGTFLPGHGGMLDRFDSVLLAAPVAFCVCLALNLI